MSSDTSGKGNTPAMESRTVFDTLKETNRKALSAKIVIGVGLALAVVTVKRNPKARRFDLEGAFVDIVPNPSMDMTGLVTKDGRPIQELFRYQPMRYYTFVFRAFDEEQTEGYWGNLPAAVHLICVRSTGRIEFHHVLPVRDWLKFEGIGSG